MENVIKPKGMIKGRESYTKHLEVVSGRGQSGAKISASGSPAVTGAVMVCTQTHTTVTQHARRR